MDKLSAGIKEAAQLISRARCAVALTGAGMSVASGIPDFRSPGGLWSKHDPEKVASIRALQSDPVTVWKFLLEADSMLKSAEPNAGHKGLAQLEKDGYIHGVITQNIDGLHQRSGSRNVIEFHGNCSEFYCMECFSPYAAEKIKPGTELPVRCPECSGVVRPDLVFFGEQIPSEAYASAFELADQSDLVIVAGTSGGVVPASLIPPRIQGAGGKIIEINKAPSAYTSFSDVFIQGAAEDVLPAIVQNLS
ncbi:NAD-dependent deacylase [Desulfovibrio sp. JC010]|uniref:SIR2 family NAD-dependent protein deacylase n=1 Tax=Desulfovibrio sp. JC010 TaxID=2593641 RepID=UPI0013D067CB|nr:NAD-dependent deacylase [Desulfovibrio sp. JC010]NDV28461.1 NAD-dependent deacylase [Desulfovibrio sp. JC010]